MFADVGVIGRTIESKIERNLHSAFAHFALQPIEIFQRPESRLNRFVAACFASDRPRNTRLARFSGHGIVSAFSVGVTDRMDRGKINYVEAHCLRVVHSRQTIAKCRSPLAEAFSSARKKFIPRCNLGFLAL